VTTTSIIIPAYNRAEFLEATIYSALNQDISCIEVIVVDDGSTDSTRDLCLSLGSAIRYYYQSNSGLAIARNSGLRLASGTYVVFLDSDDLIRPEKVRLQMAAMDGAPATSCVYSRWRLIDAAGRTLAEDGADNNPTLRETLLYTNVAPFHSFLFRTDVVRAAGGFDAAVGGCEDWDLLIRLAWRGHGFTFVPNVTAEYRIHGASMSANVPLMLRSGLGVLEKAFTMTCVPKDLVFLRDVGEALQYLEAAAKTDEMQNTKLRHGYVFQARKRHQRLRGFGLDVPPDINGVLAGVHHESATTIEIRAAQKLLRDWARDRMFKRYCDGVR